MNGNCSTTAAPPTPRLHRALQTSGSSMTTQHSKRSKRSAVPSSRRAAALAKVSAERLRIAQAAAAEATGDLLEHGIPIVYAERGKVYRKRSAVAAPEYIRDLPDTALVGAKRK